MPHPRRIRFACILTWLLAGQALFPQINLGDVIRRRPVTPRLPNPGGVIPGRGAPKDKCRALAGWMSMLEREYPKVDFRTTALDRLYPKAVNLFRDEYFVPFYGRPFAQTSDAERRTYLQTVFRACGPNQLTAEELATFQRLRVIVERPFILALGSFSYREVTAGVAERQALVQWRDDALRELAALPASFDGADKLEAYRNKARVTSRSFGPANSNASCRWSRSVTRHFPRRWPSN